MSNKKSTNEETHFSYTCVGPSGDPGTNGNPGPAGVSGMTGATGPTGGIGFTGSSGVPGATGETDLCFSTAKLNNFSLSDFKLHQRPIRHV